MKNNSWLIGLILVILGAFAYAYSSSSSSNVWWIVATMLMVSGGFVLIGSYLSSHKHK